MASKYLTWKYRDVQPEEKPRELTAKEKRANWWHYHKWYVAGGIVLAAALGSILWNALGIGKVVPDCQVAYVGSSLLPADTVSALENALARLAAGEGGYDEIVVKINQYVSAGGSGDEDAAMYATAANTTMMADLTSCDSYFFLLEDPYTFQQKYQVLRRLDGTLPTDFDRDYENCYLPWADCPALSGLELGSYAETILDRTVSGDNQELLSQLYIARRGFWTDKTVSDPDKCDALWAELTKGVF